MTHTKTTLEPNGGSKFVENIPDYKLSTFIHCMYHIPLIYENAIIN